MEGDGFLPLFGWLGIFPNSEQVVESNVDEAGNGGPLGAGSLGLPVSIQKVGGKAHRDSILGLGGGVLVLVGVDDPL